jgi:hypothetical protein
MAFLGSIGKAFGLGNTQQALTTFGFNPQIAAAAQVGAEGLSRLTGGGTGVSQNVAYDTASGGAQETSQSSAMDANIGSLSTGIGQLTRFLQGAGGATGRFLTSPQGQLATGLGLAAGGAAISFIDPNTGMPKRLTRKMQAQVKQMVEIIGIEQTAVTLGLSVMEVAQILTYKFRRRSAGITGAQLRTAQRVNNKIIHMHDKLKASYGAATRRTTTRRAASTRVTQIKN